MTNSSVTVIVSSKYLQINEIHDIRERFIIPLVFPIFVGIQLKQSANDWNGNPSSTDKESAIDYLDSGIHSLKNRSQDCPGLPWTV